MEVNRNIDKNLLPSSSGSSSSRNTCRASMTKSLNQNYIYDSNNYLPGSNYSSGFLRQESLKTILNSATTSTVEKKSTKLAFSIDPLYNNLWVYNGNTKSISCYNILASELRTMGNQVFFCI